MHWIIAYMAWPSTDLLGGAAYANELAAQRQALESMLSSWTIESVDAGDEERFSMPHERAWALGVDGAADDGLIPWAATLAANDGVELGPMPLALLSPTHWHVHVDHVSLVDPQALALTEEESRALWGTLAPLLQSSGYQTAWGHCNRWYMAHPSLATLRSASVDRVLHAGLEAWQPQGEAARRWRQLQNEMQMLLHEHPVNEAREQRGQLAVNSVWLSGSGPSLQDAQRLAAQANTVQLDTRLRQAWLAGDGQAWLQAWASLHREVLAPLQAAPHPSTRLTFSGLHSSFTCQPDKRSAWRRWLTRRDPRVASLLAAL